jgi:hypothetical protein
MCNAARFTGAVVDTGASKSVIGRAQAEASCQSHNLRFDLQPSSASFRFADQVCKSMDSMIVLIPTPEAPLKIRIDVVAADVPMLIGLDILTRHGLNVLVATDELKSAEADWVLPLLRQSGHLALTWLAPYKLWYTSSQLLRMHKHLAHPSTAKLLNLLQKATPDGPPPGTRAIFDDIFAACHACQVFSSRPITFQVRRRRNHLQSRGAY